MKQIKRKQVPGNFKPENVMFFQAVSQPECSRKPSQIDQILKALEQGFLKNKSLFGFHPKVYFISCSKMKTIANKI